MLNFDDLLRISTAFWCSAFNYLRSFQCRRVKICFFKFLSQGTAKCLFWDFILDSSGVVCLDLGCDWIRHASRSVTVSIVYCVVFLSQLMLSWFIMFWRRQKKGSSELDSHSGRNDLAWSADANLRGISASCDIIKGWTPELYILVKKK